MIKLETVQTIVALNLQLFAEGGASGTGEGGQTGETGTAAVSQTGDNAQDPGVQQTDANGDRSAAYEAFIKEHKDLDDARIQSIVQKRLKNTKETVERYESLAPTLDMLARKYGVDSTDIAALNKAIEDDDSYYEEEAMEKGISVEQLKEIRKMEKENAELKKQMQERESQEKASQLYASWMQQAEQLKSIYPSFDLETELKNPKFMDLLRVPAIDVRTAYEVIHKDDIIHGAMQFTAKTVEKKLTDKVMANGARPMENGTSSQSASLTKSDVSQLSKADRADLIRRAARGEKIRF